MSKVNITPIENGLKEHNVVTTSFDVPDGELLLIGTYDKAAFDKMTGSISETIIDPEKIEGQ